jgi:cytidyltransferase-like protein
MKIVAVSGGFDPIHVGHVRLINEAKKLGDELIVIINNDIWLKKKKKYNFMSQEDRVEIISNLKAVDKVVLTSHDASSDDMSVCNELNLLKPDIFANGGDRKEDNIPEYELCNKLGIKMVFNVGGEKLRSSSDLVRDVKLERV